MDELEKINWSNDFYSDIFSLHLDSLFSTVESENLEMNENLIVCEVEDTTNQASERVVFAETTTETNKLRFQTSLGFLLPQTSYLKRVANSHLDSVTPFRSMILSCQRSPYLVNIQLRLLLHRNSSRISRPAVNQRYFFEQ